MEVLEVLEVILRLFCLTKSHEETTVKHFQHFQHFQAQQRRGVMPVSLCGYQ